MLSFCAVSIEIVLKMLNDAFSESLFVNLWSTLKASVSASQKFFNVNVPMLSAWKRFKFSFLSSPILRLSQTELSDSETDTSNTNVVAETFTNLDKRSPTSELKLIRWQLLWYQLVCARLVRSFQCFETLLKFQCKPIRAKCSRTCSL